jgi:hypothetical protein
VNLFARDHHFPGDTAKTGAQRAEIDRPVIAVTGRSAGEKGEIAVAAGVDEGFRAQAMQAAVTTEADRGDALAVARRLADEGVQEHCDAGIGAELVERALHRFRIKNDKHAAMPDRRSDGVEASQFAEHLARYSGHRLTHWFAKRIKAAIGQHVACGRCTAEAAGLLDECGSGAAPRRGDGRRDPGTSAADHDDIEIIGRGHRT